MQTLHTPRLALLPLSPRHAPAMFALLSDPVLYAHLDEPPPASVEALAARYARLQARRSPDGAQHWLNWALSRATGAAVGELLGYVQATVEPTGTAWVAWVLGRAHWGQGCAREACEAMLAHLGQAYGVLRLRASVEADNLRSRGLLQRLGFREATAEEAGELAPSERLYLR